MAYFNNNNGKKVREFFNVKLTYADFDGSVSRYNKYGGKKINIRIFDEDEANELYHEGWPIRSYTRPSDGEVIHYIQAKIEYYPEGDKKAQYNPDIILITNNKKVVLHEDTLKCLNNVDIDNIDVVLTTSTYKNERDDGTFYYSAFVKNMAVTGHRSRFEEKYADENYD